MIVSWYFQAKVSWHDIFDIFDIIIIIYLLL